MRRALRNAATESLIAQTRSPTVRPEANELRRTREARHSRDERPRHPIAAGHGIEVRAGGLPPPIPTGQDIRRPADLVPLVVRQDFEVIDGPTACQVDRCGGLIEVRGDQSDRADGVSLGWVSPAGSQDVGDLATLTCGI